MTNLLSDLRYSARMLAKAPAFTGIAVLALALGIGANTAMFSVVHAVLLQPLPYPDSDRLMLLRERMQTYEAASLSYPNYLDWRAGQRSFTDLAMYRGEGVNLAGSNEETAPERVRAARVTHNFLEVLAVRPLIGRDFEEKDDLEKSAPVALISDPLWQRRFGGSPRVLGRRVLIDGVPREIIGVLPKHVRFAGSAEVYIPLAELRGEKSVLSRGNHPGFSGLGRLKDGITLEQARADLNTIAAELERRYPDSNTGRTVNVRPLLEAAVGEYRKSLNLLLAAVGCVLLISCANVANLQLARSISRARELAVRTALGASRLRLVRLLLAESMLLSLVGAAAGTLLALWSLDLIKALSPQNVTRFSDITLSLPTLGYTTIIALVAGLLVGIWPALRISRATALAQTLQEAGTRGGSEGGRSRTRAILVVVQVALAVVLLAGAGLTLKSFWQAQNEPLGFNPKGILTMTVALPRGRYKEDPQIVAFYNKLLERVRSLPGVDSAAISMNAPFDNSDWDSSFHIVGTPPHKHGEEPAAEINVVTSEYFRVMGMPMLQGRTFGPQDQANSPKVIAVDKSMVDRYFAGREPIGVQLDDNQTTMEENPPPLTVVGVVPRVRTEAPGEENIEKFKFPQIYFCSDQLTSPNNNLLVRVKSGDPLALVPAIRREIGEIDPDQPIDDVSTMEQNISASLSTRRLMMGLLGSFAGLALALASVGLYGVMALTVTQRTRELGIRLALGANRADVFRLVLSHGAILISIGLVLGVFGALGAGRALQSLLYGVGAIDLPALLTAIVSLSLVSFLACFFPARRATRVDPMVALRYE